MITILNTNKKKLIDHISKCSGSVFLHLNDGTICDIKNDTLASNMFQSLEIPKEGVKLTVSDPHDFVSFIRYMMDVRFHDA